MYNLIGISVYTETDYSFVETSVHKSEIHK